MARLPRFVIVDQPQHVIVRGNNRDPIFLADEDYQFYLEKLKQACEKHTCDLHAYVLMTNHVHLLITPHTEQGLSKVMQMIGRYYVQYFNHSYQRTGTLWEGRYKATLIDSERYLLTCYRYIELNPVRASDMAEHPADYPWSSYRYNALGQEDSLITPHAEYLQLGDNAAERQHAYRDLFNHHITQRTLADIRQATNKAWILGSQHFKNKIEQQLNRRINPLPKGGDRKSAAYRERIKLSNES
ncbi:MAG: transposase [Methylophaga sp.]|nr:MAG: transposase [Methylophaga sp.]